MELPLELFLSAWAMGGGIPFSVEIVLVKLSKSGVVRLFDVLSCFSSFMLLKKL
jgi:hypothetical protein